MDEKCNKVNWFVEYNCHVILSAVLTALIAVWGGSCISNNIKEAQLLKTFMPELVSVNSYQQKIALYAVEVGVSKEVRGKVESILADDIAEKISVNLGQNNLETAKANLDAAYIVSPRIFDDVRSRIEKQTDIRVSPENKQQLLMYTPGDVPQFNK